MGVWAPLSYWQRSVWAAELEATCSPRVGSLQATAISWLHSWMLIPLSVVRHGIREAFPPSPFFLAMTRTSPFLEQQSWLKWNGMEWITFHVSLISFYCTAWLDSEKKEILRHFILLYFSRDILNAYVYIIIFLNIKLPNIWETLKNSVKNVFHVNDYNQPVENYKILH